LKRLSQAALRVTLSQRREKCVDEGRIVWQRMGGEVRAGGDGSLKEVRLAVVVTHFPILP
jgi:hypothetical protein